MLPAFYQICFYLWLAAVCSTKTEVTHKNFTNHVSVDNETRCSWHWTVVGSDLTEKMKTILAKGRVIRLIVKYGFNVDEKCGNQYSRNSNGSASEHWQMWLSINNLSKFAYRGETFLSVNLKPFPELEAGSRAGYNEIRAVCTLKPSRIAAASNNKSTGIYGDVKNLLVVDPRRNEQLCNSRKGNLKPYINITKSAGNDTDHLVNRREGFYLSLLVFLGANFVFYAPAILCFFFTHRDQRRWRYSYDSRRSKSSQF